MHRIGELTDGVLKEVKKRKEGKESMMASKVKCNECKKLLSADEVHCCWEKHTPLLCSEHRKMYLKERKQKSLQAISQDLDRILAQRNVPVKYQEVSLSNFKVVDSSTEKALNRAKDYAFNQGSLATSTPGEGIFMYGPNGTGKTHLAVAIMRELTLAGQLDWYFIKAPKLLMAIRRTYKAESAQTEEQLIERFVNYKYLVIDELGVEKVTDWSLQTLYLIIDGRSDSLKSTIITSNLSLDGIKKRIEARIASRIVGMSSEILKFQCADWRLAKRREKVEGGEEK